MQRDEIRNILKENIAEVTFEKKDGSIRVMECTLIEAFLPALAGSNSKRSDKVLPVWDLEADGWRSFRIDSIKQINILEEC